MGTRPTDGRRDRIARAAGAAVLLAVAAAGLATTLLATGGCAAAGLRPLRRLDSESETKITEEELAERLDRFAELYAQTMIEGVRMVTEGETEPARQRAALVWQIQSIRTCRNAVLAADPQVAFTDVWVLCLQQRAYVESSAFAERAGPRSEVLVAVTRNLESEIEKIGAGFLQPAELERARSDVQAFAKSFPLQDGFARAAPLPSTAGETAAGRLSWVTSIPMAPFKFVTGIDEGAAAIRHFSSVADRFARRVDTLPQETLWETRLLLFDLEQRPAVQTTVASIESAAKTGESLAASADRFTRTAETLPADLRKELDAALDQIDAKQPELRATIADVRRALADAKEIAERADAVVREAKTTGEGFDQTAKSVGEAAKALEGAVRAYQTMMQAVHPPAEHPEPKEPGAKSFDVMDWKQTADSIAKAAAELRGTLAEFRTTMTDDAVRERAGAAARAAREEAEAAIDHAFVRALELLAAIAVVVVVLRVLGRGRTGSGPPRT